MFLLPIELKNPTTLVITSRKQPFVLYTTEEEAHRPSPPTRTSASRTTDWKVKYSPQTEEETYRVEPRAEPRAEPWRGGQVGDCIGI